MMQPPITPSDIARNPVWFAHRYDAQRDLIQFAEIDRVGRRTATFLTDEYLLDLSLVPIPRTDALAPLPPTAPLCFIFHSAFCCSTLLANAFDLPGYATSLKEPMIFNDVVGFYRRGGGRANAERLMDDACALLARPFESGEVVLIKPSNIVNGFASDLMRLRPEAKALLLHAPLDVFLGSVAKKGLWGRLWVRQLFLGLAKDGLLPFGYGQDEYFGQSDLQIAAICWLAQQALFAAMIRRFGARVRSLNSEEVTARPRRVIAAIGTLFEIDLDAKNVDDIVAGPAFTRHSKFGTVFDGEARTMEIEDARTIHSDELEKVAMWAGTVAQAHGIAMTLPSPLLP